jgi:MYXO-CTERM domain-containing protein
MARRKRAELEARDPALKRRRRARWAIFTVSLAGIWVLIARGVIHLPAQFAGLGGGGSSSRPGRVAVHGGSGAPSHTDWTIAIVLWLAMAALAVIAVRRYRRARAAREAGTLPNLVPDVGGGVDYARLRAIGDPRAAVVATYAQMERTLAERSLGRDPAEGPGEYLTRIVGGLRRSRQAAGRLTRLYERAKFSPHAVDASMRDDAVDSLRAVDDDTAEAP